MLTIKFRFILYIVKRIDLLRKGTQKCTHIYDLKYERVQSQELLEMPGARLVQSAPV